jgi:hypothetical protein
MVEGREAAGKVCLCSRPLSVQPLVCAAPGAGGGRAPAGPARADQLHDRPDQLPGLRAAGV